MSKKNQDKNSISSEHEPKNPSRRKLLAGAAGLGIAAAIPSVAFAAKKNKSHLVSLRVEPPLSQAEPAASAIHVPKCWPVQGQTLCFMT